MSRVLMDIYSVVVLQEALVATESGRQLPHLKSLSNIIENLVLCDKILLEARGSQEWNVSNVSDHFPDVFEFIESGEALGLGISKEPGALHTYTSRLYGYSPYLENARENRYLYSKEFVDAFLRRTDRYLALARKLGVYLSLHPRRSAYLRNALGEPNRQSASQVAVSYFDKRLGSIEAAKYAGVDISVPPVVEYVSAFAAKNKVDLLTASNEIRHGKNAVTFRERCAKVDDEVAACSGRASVLSLQKLLNEIDRVASKWESDLDEGVKYVRREVSLRKVWGLGSILESFGLDKLTIKDPIVFPNHADLLFLNDLYRIPLARQTRPR